MNDPNDSQQWQGLKYFWKKLQYPDRYDLLNDVHRRLDRYHMLAKQLEKLMEASVGLVEEWNKNHTKDNSTKENKKQP